MSDFLLFNRFITRDVLVVFYYITAVLMPPLLWFSRRWIIQHLKVAKSVDQTIQNLYNSLSIRGKFAAALAIVGLFLCMELCWRMLFEAMIGYFDMHDYLYEIYKHKLG